MLKRIKDNHDIMKNCVGREFRSLLKYNKSRVIDLDEDTSNSSDDISTSNNDDAFLRNFKISIVRGMNVKETQKEQLKQMLRNRDYKALWSNIGMATKVH